VQRTLGASGGDPALTRIYGLWHKEIFADLAAILLGGPAAAWGMAVFLANPAPRTMTFRPGGAHPTAYLRVHILAEMLRRLGFDKEAGRLAGVWNDLYNPRRVNRLPARLLMTSSQIIPEVVDEIAFQTRRNLAQRSLADIIHFDANDEKAIRAGATILGHGRIPQDLPPRHLVSAAGYALTENRIAPRLLSNRVIARLNELKNLPAGARSETRPPIAA
jgi:hypothetical protein